MWKQRYFLRGVTACATIAMVATLCGLPAEARKEAKKENVEIITEKRDGDKTFITGRTLINAPAEIVWQTVHEERQKDPDIEYSKILESHENHCRLEQKFKLIPVIGTAVCQMHNSEVPFKRIDYKLISSDRFKSMEGSWVLSPGASESCTVLELTTHLDLGFPVPQGVMTSVTSGKLKKRLGNVKKMAERMQKQVASTREADLQ